MIRDDVARMFSPRVRQVFPCPARPRRRVRRRGRTARVLLLGSRRRCLRGWTERRLAFGASPPYRRRGHVPGDARAALVPGHPQPLDYLLQRATDHEKDARVYARERREIERVRVVRGGDGEVSPDSFFGEDDVRGERSGEGGRDARDELARAPGGVKSVEL